jgi:hypothetical protein
LAAALGSAGQFLLLSTAHPQREVGGRMEEREEETNPEEGLWILSLHSI